MNTKICGTCKLDLPVEQFGRRKLKNGYGYKSDCNRCKNLKSSARYQEKRLDPEYMSLMRSRSASYRESHPGWSAEASKRWRENNPGAQTLSESKWRETNRPKFNAKCGRVNQVRRARKKEALIILFTQEQLDARLSMYSGCWMCDGPKEAVDHVKPICVGGPHILANLRPICKSCNSKKGGKWPL